ncbi:hypothetical protein D917_00248 [Trichinella nativa]|uniref:Uncharacterized protein n=1 Tax=Trichinella nativa TaxID=6335 RepID=A0A1Y3EIG7_9BILA|nr:hypothetical protein D917_00248 [Trichinella nativa]
MGCRTEPGYPPQGHMIEVAVGVCKHCIQPKPPRTHHCSETCHELVSGRMVQYLILVEFFVALAIVVGLLWLIYSHGKIISNGETSIEYYINLATAKKFAMRRKVYMNPYDFGWRKNWKSFLGIDDFRGDFFKKIIIPSVYQPNGDGLIWPFAFSLDELLPHVQRQT